MPLANLISAAIEPLPQSVIDRCTIWTTVLQNDGRCYSYRYEAYDKEMLMGYAEAKRAAIDMMRSPSLSTMKLQTNGLWAIELTYYGLD
jgi:hypothetical protein